MIYNCKQFDESRTSANINKRQKKKNIEHVSYEDSFSQSHGGQEIRCYNSSHSDLSRKAGTLPQFYTD